MSEPAQGFLARLRELVSHDAPEADAAVHLAEQAGQLVDEFRGQAPPAAEAQAPDEAASAPQAAPTPDAAPEAAEQPPASEPEADAAATEEGATAAASVPAVGSLAGYQVFDGLSVPPRERTQVILLTAQEQDAAGAVRLRGLPLGYADDAASFTTDQLSALG